jgi:hypothetical protein
MSIIIMAYSRVLKPFGTTDTYYVGFFGRPPKYYNILKAFTGIFIKPTEW